MTLEMLLSPILSKICQYHAFKQAGCEPPYEKLMQELDTELNELSLKCSSSPVLKERYRKIEKPLIFFIDYTIKEGNFSFSHQYQELARNYNELSGDDKFFDLLEEAQRQGDDQEVLRVFYLMLGLGFDGAYKRERSEVIGIMASLKEKIRMHSDVLSQKLCPCLTLHQDSKAVRAGLLNWMTLKKVLIALCIITVICMVINAVSLSNAVGPFVQAVDKAASLARPYIQ